MDEYVYACVCLLVCACVYMYGMCVYTCVHVCTCMWGGQGEGDLERESNLTAIFGHFSGLNLRREGSGVELCRVERELTSQPPSLLSPPLYKGKTLRSVGCLTVLFSHGKGSEEILTRSSLSPSYSVRLQCTLEQEGHEVGEVSTREQPVR